MARARMKFTAPDEEFWSVLDSKSCNLVQFQGKGRINDWYRKL